MSTQTLHKKTNTEFENALQREIPSLRKSAKWLAGDDSRAEDLLQDTMLLALRFQESFKEGTNLRAWLMRVMKNRHISLLRRKSLERKIMETEGTLTLTYWSVGSMGIRTTRDEGDVYMDEGFSDQVVHAMEDLRPEFRQAVMLCDVEGMSYADAANRISCPVGTIMSRLHRGRRALRRSLGSRRRMEAAA